MPSSLHSVVYATVIAMFLLMQNISVDNKKKKK
jgi:hypothetical protein